MILSQSDQAADRIVQIQDKTADYVRVSYYTYFSVSHRTFSCGRFWTG